MTGAGVSKLPGPFHKNERKGLLYWLAGWSWMMLSEGADATVNWEPLSSQRRSQLKPEGTLGLPLLSTWREEGMEPIVGWRWLSDLDWKCRCSGAECVICVIAPGNRNCLAKVTDGVQSHWRFAVAETQEALSLSAVFIVVKSRSRQQQSNTHYHATMVGYFKAAVNVFATFYAAVLTRSPLQKRFRTSVGTTWWKKVKLNF